ncbi:hypothetical protein D3C71_1470110 [compost metagenome]
MRRLAVQRTGLDQPEEAAVGAVAAVVAEHQHLPGRHGQPADVRTAALAEIEPGQVLAEILDLARARLGQRLAVDAQVALVQLHPVTADRGDALDQPRAVHRRVEHGHIAAPWLAGVQQFERGERQAQAVGAHVHHHAVAGHQGVLHRAAGHLVVVGQRIARGHEQAEHERQGQGFLLQPGQQPVGSGGVGRRIHGRVLSGDRAVTLPARPEFPTAARRSYAMFTPGDQRGHGGFTVPGRIVASPRRTAPARGVP